MKIFKGIYYRIKTFFLWHNIYFTFYPLVKLGFTYSKFKKFQSCKIHFGENLLGTPTIELIIIEGKVDSIGYHSLFNNFYFHLLSLPNTNLEHAIDFTEYLFKHWYDVYENEEPEITRNRVKLLYQSYLRKNRILYVLQ